MADLGHGRALYSISVASELTGVNPQMLRAYESKGLLSPFRTEGGTRRYSSGDLDRIGEITELLAAGLNLAGVEHVLALRAETLHLRAEIDRLRTRTPTSNHQPRSADPHRSTERE
jgi:MerR family transcriptional regulator/heat shock protein HspR